MSCLTLFPFGHTLDYWWESLRGEPDRLRFLMTKMIELHAFRANFRRNKRRPQPATPPTFQYRQGNNGLTTDARVAVVVPALLRTTHDGETLAALLEALERQSRTHRVIVVDDGSPRPIVAPERVMTCRLKRNVGPAAARNRGIAIALAEGAEVIALTDADCLPEPGWLQEFVDTFITMPDAHLLSGNTRAYDRGWFGRYHERNGTLNGRRFADTDALLYGPTCNLAGTASVFSALRFDEAFPSAAAEDIEFCYRANGMGFRIVHCPRAIVEHDFGYHRLPAHHALIRFWRQFRRYAEGEPRLLDRHPDYLAAFGRSVEIPAHR